MTIVTSHGLSKKETQSYLLPKNSRILSVYVKQENIYVSIEHDVNADMFSQRVEFAVFKEGRHFNVNGYNFLGTVILNFGNTIYHVFYKTQ